MKIIGYNDLSQPQIDLINEIKTKEAEVAALVRKVQELHHNGGISVKSVDGGRQSSIARTAFEEAFMRLVRSVALPDSPWSPWVS